MSVPDQVQQMFSAPSTTTESSSDVLETRVVVRGSREDRLKEIEKLEREVKSDSGDRASDDEPTARRQRHTPEPDAGSDTDEDVEDDDTDLESEDDDADDERDNDEEGDDKVSKSERKKSAQVPYKRFKAVNDFATEAQRIAGQALLRAEQAERELEQLRSKAVIAEAPAPAQLKEPEPSDFATQGEYLKAYSKYSADLLKQDMALNDARTKQQDHVAQVVSKTMEVFTHKVTAAKQFIPDIQSSVDFMDHLSDDPRFPAHVAQAVLDSENSPEVCHFLAKNHDALRDLITSDPKSVLRKVTELDVQIRLAKQKINSEPTHREKPVREEVPVPRKLPVPAKTRKDPSEMTRAEFRKWAYAQEKRR